MALQVVGKFLSKMCFCWRLVYGVHYMCNGLFGSSNHQLIGHEHFYDITTWTIDVVWELIDVCLCFCLCLGLFIYLSVSFFAGRHLSFLSIYPFCLFFLPSFLPFFILFYLSVISSLCWFIYSCIHSLLFHLSVI